MEISSSPVGDRPAHRIAWFTFSIVAVLLLGLPGQLSADPTTPNILPAGSFDAVLPTYLPWAGVDGQNHIHGLEGHQFMVTESGGLDNKAVFGPSIGVADMNGDGKQDLILADSRGFFWYYPNTGTPTAPAFTQAEVVPIWLAEQPDEGNHEEGFDNVVPRIQLLDFNNSKKFDVVAGTYSGKLFHIPNIGSTSQPNFRPTTSLDQLIINTRRKGMLWCNYLAPFFTNSFSGTNILDLVMGEGTYSANSIWFIHNTDTNDHPLFDEEHTKRMIPGMGLEHLTPQVVDWNNDGKPDIITGDRTGHITLYLNNSTDPANPTFAPGTQLSIGGLTTLGQAVTVTVCDLSNNKLPNLLIGRSDGTVLYAVNTGTPGNPKFTTPATPLNGVLPPDYKSYTSLTQWWKAQAYGVPYELVSAVNPQLETGFAFPEGVKRKYALKFWVWPYKNLYFQRYYPTEEDAYTEHVLRCTQGVTLKMNTRYLLHFWVRAPNDSVSSFRYNLWDYPRPGSTWAPAHVDGDIATSSSWTEVTRSFNLSNSGDPTVLQYGYQFEFRFHGQATFYIADLQIQEDKS